MASAHTNLFGARYFRQSIGLAWTETWDKEKHAETRKALCPIDGSEVADDCIRWIHRVVCFHICRSISKIPVLSRYVQQGDTFHGENMARVGGWRAANNKGPVTMREAVYASYCETKDLLDVNDPNNGKLLGRHSYVCFLREKLRPYRKDIHVVGVLKHSIPRTQLKKSRVHPELVQDILNLTTGSLSHSHILVSFSSFAQTRMTIATVYVLTRRIGART